MIPEIVTFYLSISHLYQEACMQEYEQNNQDSNPPPPQLSNFHNSKVQDWDENI